MKYTITIKDNQNDEILIDNEANCIIGAINTGDYTDKIILSSASVPDFKTCVVRASEAVDYAVKSFNDYTKLEEVKQWVKSFEYQRP